MKLVRWINEGRLVKHQVNLGTGLFVGAAFATGFAETPFFWVAIGAVVGWAITQAVYVYSHETSPWREIP
jgi:hypothetical protein